MTVSIIVVAYNAQDCLPRCLDSVFAQTYEDLQIVLVDDGSTDRTAQLVDEAAARDARCLAIHRKNAGPPAARNTGLDAVKGSWLMFVDADDVIESGYVRELVEAAQAHDADVVVSDCLIVEGDTKSRFGHIVSGKRYDSRDELYQDFLEEKIPWSLWGKLYRACLFEDIRFDAGDYIAEDLDANARIFAREGLCLVTHESAGYHYYVQEGSVDHTFTERHLCQFDVFERVVELVQREHIRTQTSAAVFYEERVLNCLRKALDAKALTPALSRAFRDAIRSHRKEVLSDKQASAQLKIRLLATYLGPRIFGVFHRMYS